MRNAILTFILLSTLSVYASPRLSATGMSGLECSDRQVIVGQAHLPAGGTWDAVEADPSSGVSQVYLLPEQGAKDALMGDRIVEMQKMERTERPRHAVRPFYWPCHAYATNHDGYGPASIEALSTNAASSLSRVVTHSPWHHRDKVEAEGPYMFLVPHARFAFGSDGRRVPRHNRVPLALELRPYVDDGKHWVAFTDGSVDRVDIDKDLIAKHDVTIRPVLAAAPADDPDLMPYSLVALRSGAATGSISLTFHDSLGGETLKLTWDLSASPREGKGPGVTALAKARSPIWDAYLKASDSPVLSTWVSTLGAEQNKDRRERRRRRDRRRGNQTSAFAFLGGRAAVEETLQMQVLNQMSVTGKQSVSVAEMTGVEVKSHPYDEMLSGVAGGSLELADHAPADHFFVYVGKPSALMPMLDDGASFISRSGGAMTGNCIRYDLKERYLARLGFDDRWLRMFMKSGAVKECAMIFPDLFLIDGTEVTVLTRLAKPGLVGSLLEMIGVRGLKSGALVEHKLDSGKSSFWSLDGDLLVVSSSRAEAALVLELGKAKGEGSLGRSAEFRYMLTQLPVNAETRIYAYFSDPFVRHLVGPSAKMGQLRRVCARAEMEHIVAKALLARLNGVSGPLTIETLIECKYLHADLADKGYALSSDLNVSSTEYGTLESMATLLERPAVLATPEEAAAYERYVNNYSRFWRRFFDPIAMRIDDVPGGSLEATTFILPLIDNSIYNGMKEVLVTDEEAELRVPQLSSEPVLMLSLNVKEEAWTGLLRGLVPFFTKYSPVGPAILDDFGPTVHLAIQDGDPVIALGSGDLFGIFGSGSMGGGEEMLMIPVLLSILTRPCTLAIETRDTERTLSFLRQAAETYVDSQTWTDDMMSTAFYQIGDRDEWVYSFDLGGVVKLRFGLELDGDFLLVRNVPWSNKDQVVETVAAPLRAAQLQAFPGSCQLQLPGLHASAGEKNRVAAMAGAGHLYPLLASGETRTGQAEEKHMRLFGYAPVHPGSGRWDWNGAHVLSTEYGSVFRQKQPAYGGEDERFGLFSGVDDAQVSMQFEDTGLRTKIRWTTR